MTRQTPVESRTTTTPRLRIVVTTSAEGKARFSEDARGNLTFVDFTPARGTK